MADRPSVKDILALARAGGPAKPAEESAPAPVAASADPAPTPTAPAAPSTASAPPAPSPSSLGRPLTLKEKLAAAKNRPVGDSPAPAPSVPAPAVVVSETTPEPEPAAAVASAPTPADLGRPLTLKEKLAAARGGATAPAPGRPAAKPAAATAGATKAVAASTRTLPPLDQMEQPGDLAEALRRAGATRQKASQAEVAKSAPAAKAPKRAESKVVPPRPGRELAAASTANGVAVAEAPATRPTRRVFFSDTAWIAAGWAAFAAGMGALTTMTVRFLFPNVLAEPPSTIKVGIPSNFERGEVNENWKSQWGFWIVRSDYFDGEDKIYALSSTCTHLGCPPAWLAGEQKFKCPCHGSGFYISGVNFEGPAPRPLERFKITLGDDGQLLVDKSAKFQQELDQWSDPTSFFKA